MASDYPTMMKGIMRRSLFCMGIAVLLAAAATSVGGQTVNQPPVARVAAFKANGGQESTVILDASQSTDTDGRIVRYQWLFGDGTTGSGREVEHTFPKVDLYTVTLLVADDRGATHMVSQSVDISQLPPQTSKPLDPTAGMPGVTENVAVGNRIGQRAPAFALPSLDDAMVKLSDYLGRVVLLEFWTSSCPGCRASTPQLDAFRQTYEDRGLTVILVILDRTPGDAIALLNEYGYTDFVTAREIDASNKPTMHAYGVSVVPHAFVIDRTGVIRYSGHPAYLEANQIEAWL